MSHSEIIHYTNSFDLKLGQSQRLLPVGAIILRAYANSYGSITIDFMATRRRDAEREPLPSADASSSGIKLPGFYLYVFHTDVIGRNLPQHLWCTPLKIETPDFKESDALYLFYALVP